MPTAGPEHELERQERAEVAAAQRDPQAFAPLYERYHKPIFLFVRKRVGSNDAAGDLTAQVFLKALLALPRYTDRGLPFKAWLYRIALNEVLMHHRRAKGRVYMDIDAPDATRLLLETLPQDADGQKADDMNRLTRALSRLAVPQAILVELHWFDGLSYAEMGQMLGIAEDAVKMRTHRVIQQLRRYLRPGR